MQCMILSVLSVLLTERLGQVLPLSQTQFPYCTTREVLLVLFLASMNNTTMNIYVPVTVFDAAT